MNPWLAIVLGFAAGFAAGTIVFLLISMYMGYTTAIVNERLIDEEIKRRKEDNKNEQPTEIGIT